MPLSNLYGVVTSARTASPLNLARPYVPGRMKAGDYLLRVQRIVLSVGNIEKNGFWELGRIVLMQADTVTFTQKV